MNHRLVNTVVNRCQIPTDGDIIVPIRTVSVIGTTDIHVDDPDDHAGHAGGGRRDARRRRAARARLPRRPRAARLGRRAAAVRGPEGTWPPRATSRARTRCSTTASATASSGFITITGGKLTTFRLMARGGRWTRSASSSARTGPACTEDHAASRLGGGRVLSLGAAPRAREAHLRDRAARLRVRARSRAHGSRRRCAGARAPNLDDIRRCLRLGMGPCQGGFCIYRATGILHGLGGIEAEEANARCCASCRSAGRASGRSSTATSCARHGSTTGSSRACSTWSTCMKPELHYDAVVIGDRRGGAHRGGAAGRGRRRGCACWPRASARRIWPRARRRARLRASAWSRPCEELPEFIAAPARPSLRAARRPTRSRPALDWFAERVEAGRSRATAIAARSSATCCCPLLSARPGPRRCSPRRWRTATCR